MKYTVDYDGKHILIHLIFQENLLLVWINVWIFNFVFCSEELEILNSCYM